MAFSFASSLPYFPTTFLERGVAVSFTTPVLAGTRVRPSKRTALELIVPNPSGGRGQYILPWTALQDLCRPTLYDRQLQKAVALLHGVTPASIRRVTREVAAEGLAGREARSAATEAGLRDKASLLLTNFHLLLALVQQVMPGAVDAGPPTSQDSIERGAKLAVGKVAASLGFDPYDIAHGLEELAGVYLDVGLGPDADRKARLPRVMGRLRALQADMDQWVSEYDDASAEAAHLVRSCAELTLACAAATLADARGLAMHPVELLISWQTDPERAASKAVRPEWILDGWETICAAWESAQTKAAQRYALAEISHFVPIMPREASEWVSRVDIEAEAVALFRRLVDLNHDWRSGELVMHQAARSEHLLAMSSKVVIP